MFEMMYRRNTSCDTENPGRRTGSLNIAGKYYATST